MKPIFKADLYTSTLWQDDLMVRTNVLEHAVPL